MVKNAVDVLKDTSTISSLFDNLASVEAKISSMCRPLGVSPSELEHHLDCFSLEEEDALFELLREKLALQELIFFKQGGCLENVVFLASYQ